MSENQPPNRYDHLERIVRNAVEVVLEEVARDAERLIASNPPVAHLCEYIVMLEEVGKSLDAAASLTAQVRRSMCREFQRVMEEITKEEQ